MARSKSIPGNKLNRARPDKEQPSNASPASLPEQKAVAAETASVDFSPGVKSTPAPEVHSSPEARVSPEPRKMEVVKSESRKNVVPINLDDEIRRRAFELYQQRGSGPGTEAEDWLTAEREIRQRYRQQSA